MSTRRLPVYVLLDTSGSMSGEPIQAVRSGIDMLLEALRSDPQALETAWLSFITFDSSATQVVPLTELEQIQAPSINAGGCTAMGEALSLVADCINREVKKTDMKLEIKGDWKPMVVIMSDGQPNDDFERGLTAFKAIKTGTVICYAAGADADENLLKKISEIVVKSDTADANSIQKFFQWVSASIAVTSQKIDQTNKDSSATTADDLPPPPPEINVCM